MPVTQSMPSGLENLLFVTYGSTRTLPKLEFSRQNNLAAEEDLHGEPSST